MCQIREKQESDESGTGFPESTIVYGTLYPYSLDQHGQNQKLQYDSVHDCWLVNPCANGEIATAVR